MNTRDIVRIALFAAITAILGIFPPLAVPVIGVPITAQSMGPMLAGGILGAKRGGLSMVLFAFLVLLGLPLLSGGRGGLAVLAGPTVGFFLGFIPAAFVTGWFVERFWNNLNVAKAFLAAILGGVVVDYALGIPALALVANLPLWTAASGSAAFIPGDLIKAAVAAAIILMIKRSYPLIDTSGTIRDAR